MVERKKCPNGDFYLINQKGLNVLEEVFELMDEIFYFHEEKEEEIFEINL